MGTWSFPGVKRPGRGADHPPPSKCRGHERVELYLYSPSGPSWPVVGRTLLYYINTNYKKLKKIKYVSLWLCDGPSLGRNQSLFNKHIHKSVFVWLEIFFFLDICDWIASWDFPYKVQCRTIYVVLFIFENTVKILSFKVMLEGDLKFASSFFAK